MTSPHRIEMTSKRPVRPKLSASLLIADTSGDEPRFLFGKRHERHRFMPGAHVFPGGRIDRGDHDRAFATLDWNHDRNLLARAFGSRVGRLEPHSAPVCALREAYEETGILIGTVSGAPCPLSGFSNHDLQPNLSALRLLARATTPPAYPIRFETYFFITVRDRISVEGQDFGPDSELSGLVWASAAETAELKLPMITRQILDVALTRLRDDPKLDRAAPVPDFYTIRGKHRQRILNPER